MQLEEQQLMVKAAIEKFPKVFGLRAFPGKEFSISETASYYSDMEHCVMLYVFVYDSGAARWKDFAKGTFNELRKEIVELK
jgi:hypothetical protein